jgi:DNA polymerase elongation subunit (family B)
MPDVSIDKRTKAMAKIVQDKIQPMLKIITDDVSANLNAYENTIDFKLEVIADKALWVAKKKYICRVYSSEGVEYEKPKFKIMGMEMVRSSTPKFIRQRLKDSLEIIFSGEESTVHKFIADVREEFMKKDIQEIAFPRSANNLAEYMNEDGTAKKGTPMHVAAVLVHNKLLRDLNLTHTYKEVTEGSKIKYIYLKQPNKARYHAVAWGSDECLPEEFGLHQMIDREVQFDKTFLSAMRIILDPIGWTTEEMSTLDEFF